MRTLRTKLLPVLVVALAIVACLAPAARAEVAVAMTQNDDHDLIVVPYATAITDDAEPVVGIWMRISPLGGNRVLLNETGDANGDGAPSIAVDPQTRMPIVAWSRNDAGDLDIVVSRFDPNLGDWTTPQVVAGSSEIEKDPTLVIDPADGTLHVVYWIDDATPRVLHRQAPADLSAWSAAEEVSRPGEIGLRPCAVFHAGSLMVVYEAHPYGIGQTPRQIVVGARQPDGTWLAETLATTYHGDPNRPKLHSGLGKLWVEWIDAAGEMAWSRQESVGWSALDMEPFGSVEDREFNARTRVRMTILGNGGP